MQQVERGLYWFRGDIVALFRHVDERFEVGIDWSVAKTEPSGNRMKHI